MSSAPACTRATRRGAATSVATWVLSAALTSAIATARADDIWVAPSGVDAPDRGSADRPLATLQAAADRVMPGDTVHVRDGMYAGFDLRRGGSDGSPVTIVAEGTGAHIDRPNADGRGFNVEGVSYVVVEGLEVSGATRAGARCANSRFVTFRRLVAHGNGTSGRGPGIFSGCCGDFAVEGSTSYANTEHGIYFSNSGDDSRLVGNHCFDNDFGGIQVNPDLSIRCVEVETDGISSRILIAGNRIHGNGRMGAAALNLMGLDDAVVENNLLYDNHAGGLTLFRGDAAAAPVRTLVINNTIVMPSDGRWAINIRDGASDIVLRNNIVVTAHAFRGVVNLAGATASGDHNLYWPMGPRFSDMDEARPVDLTTWAAMGQERDSAYADPATLFRDPASGDYDLLASAGAAIDRGSSERAPADDLAGRARPAGAGVDIGAYESGGTLAIDAATPMDFDASAALDAAASASDDAWAIGLDAATTGADAAASRGGCACEAIPPCPPPPSQKIAIVALLLALARRTRGARPASLGCRSPRRVRASGVRASRRTPRAP